MSDVHSTLHVHEPDGRVTPADDDRVVREALARLDARVRHEPVFDHPGTVKAWFALRLGRLEHEVFAVAFLDTRHCLIAYDEMFRGTLTMTAVYPREVVKRALGCNASAVLLAHNHPSGNPAPSEADRQITRRLVDALALVDVRVLDHIVVAAGQGLSFAEHGLL